MLVLTTSRLSFFLNSGFIEFEFGDNEHPAQKGMQVPSERSLEASSQQTPFGSYFPGPTCLMKQHFLSPMMASLSFLTSGSLIDETSGLLE